VSDVSLIVVARMLGQAVKELNSNILCHKLGFMCCRRRSCRGYKEMIGAAKRPEGMFPVRLLWLKSLFVYVSRKG
jgi:hypothetical protein